MGRNKFRNISTANDMAECGERCELVEQPKVPINDTEACARCRIIGKLSVMDVCTDCLRNCCPRCVGACGMCRLPVCSDCYQFHGDYCQKSTGQRGRPPVGSLFDRKDYDRDRSGVQVDI